MEDKVTIEILMKLREKYPLTDREKEAISEAIGVLSWTKLGQSRLEKIKKSQKEKREKKRFGTSE